MTSQDRATSNQNGTGTGQQIDASVTQAGSRVVPARKIADHSREGWGYTYFVRRNSSIKIGHTAIPKTRFKTLQVGFPEPLEVLAVVPNTIVTEPVAHQKFAHLRVSGEWFQASPELLDFIEEVKAEAAGLPKRKPDPPDHPELAVLRKKLCGQYPHMSADARPHASNLIQQIKNFLDGDEDQRERLRPFMMKSTQLLAATQ